MAEQKGKSAFDTLNAVNVNEKKEQKNKLDYLSWVWAWTEVKKRYPTATFEYIKNANGWNYHTDNRTGWVEVAVEIDGIRYVENLPIMDYKNVSIPLEKITSFDVNKALKRCLAKCIAMHGLGLYIYAGEDLPEDVENDTSDNNAKTDSKGKNTSAKSKSNKTVEATPESNKDAVLCSSCHSAIEEYVVKDGDGNPKATYPKQSIIDRSMQLFNKPVCMTCMLKAADKARKAKEQEVNENA